MYKATAMALDLYTLEHTVAMLKDFLRLREVIWDRTHGEEIVARLEALLVEAQPGSAFLLIEVPNDRHPV